MSASEIKNQIEQLKRNALRDDNTTRRSSKPSKLVRYIASKPRWMLYLIGGSLSTVLFFFFITTIVLATYNPTKSDLTLFSQNTTIGQKCSQSNQCIQDAYCNIASGQTTGTCMCIASFFLNFTSGKCNAKKAYLSSCTATYECFDNKLQTCISSQCQCDTTILFWNSTVLECQYRKAPIAYCSATAECSTFAGCSQPWPINNFPYYGPKCMCGSSYWFNVDKGACEIRKLPGTPCTVSFECIQNAFCEQTTNQCACDPAYFYANGNCYLKSGSTSSPLNSISCSYIDQCNWMQNNLRCISSFCRCDPNLEYWDTSIFYCLPRKRYGQVCSVTTECIDTTVFGLQCLNTTVASGTRKACLCPSTQYFDVVSGMCLTKKVYNSQCNSRKECADSESMVCVALGGGLTKRCLCAPNYAYFNSTSNSCTLRKAYDSTCASSTECSNLNGMGCFSSKCGCDPSLKYYDTTLGVCLPLKRTRDYCTAGTECASTTCTSNLCT